MSSQPDPAVMRIGGGGGFMVDSALAVPQLLDAGVDAIIMDFLAEGAMGIFGRMRAGNPDSGWSADFADRYIGPHLDRIAAQRVRIVTNAGGVNPDALARHLRAAIAARGLSLRVASVSGDDLMPRHADLVAAGVADWANGRALPPAGVTSINAYGGAFPIAAALRAGADIVVTGRVVDSALTLGLLIDRFGWAPHAWNLLAAGSLAGHLIECGAQATGGTYTDWDQVEGWDDIGFPIAECHADGGIVLTKPDGSGGMVTVGTVAEQLLYETGDPAAYILPDVVCDFRGVTLHRVGPDRVSVQGVRGLPRPPMLKACATFDAGWRAIAYQPMIGPRAADRARKQADALLKRGSAMLAARGWPAFSQTAAILIGDGSSVGARGAGAAAGAQEIILKIAADHDDPRAAGMFAAELHSPVCAMAPGTSLVFGASVAPVMHLISFVVPRSDAIPRLDLGEGPVPCPDPDVTSAAPPPSGAVRHAVDTLAAPAPPADSVPLASMAFLRSGEKGESVNIGVIARRPELVPQLRAALSAAAVAGWLAHLFDDPARAGVTIFELPGLGGFNILLDGALPGGLNASLRLDPAAKSIGQQMVDFPVPSS